jgi:hypothetical protein
MRASARMEADEMPRSIWLRKPAESPERADTSASERPRTFRKRRIRIPTSISTVRSWSILGFLGAGSFAFNDKFS